MILEGESSRGLHEIIRVQKNPAYAGGWNGNVLFSQGAAPQVSSGLKGLTAVFGMGTGVSLLGLSDE